MFSPFWPGSLKADFGDNPNRNSVPPRFLLRQPEVYPPFDMDLAKTKYQSKKVVEVLDL